MNLGLLLSDSETTRGKMAKIIMPRNKSSIMRWTISSANIHDEGSSPWQKTPIAYKITVKMYLEMRKLEDRRWEGAVWIRGLTRIRKVWV